MRTFMVIDVFIGIIGIKPTTLRGENIRGDRCIHWNIGIKPTTLRGENIRGDRCIHWNISTFCYLFIRMLASIVLWNEHTNAVGVALSKRNPP